MLITPAWSEVTARYRVPRRLATRARRAGFTVVAVGTVLHVTPESTHLVRNLTRGDFERAAPLLGRADRGVVNEGSRNSSYIEAILADLSQGC